MEKFSPKSPVDRFLSEKLNIESDYAERKKIYTHLYKQGLLPKPQREKYSGQLEENAALINYFQKKTKQGLRWNHESLSFESPTQKALDSLKKSVIAPQLSISEHTTYPSLRKAYQEKKQLTLNIAKRQLEAPYVQEISTAIDRLIENQLGVLSVKAFDRECTKIRKSVTARATKEKYQKIRDEYQRMNGTQFRQLREKYNGSGPIRRNMGFEKPTNGLYSTNVNFLNTKAIDSEKVFEDLIDEAVQDAAETFNVPAQRLKQLTIAILFHESKGDPLAISPGYSLGIMQLGSDMFLGGKNKAEFNQHPVNPLNPHEAIPRGVNYIAYLYKMFNGEKALVLEAYNCGERTMKKALAQNNHYSHYLPKETNRYIRKTKKDYKILQKHNPSLVNFEDI